MLGYKTRNLAIEERNAVGIGCLERNAMARCRRKTSTRAAGGADAAHRRGMRRAAIAFVGIVMLTVASLMRMPFGKCSAPMVRFAKCHKHACVSAQRHGRKQHG